MQIGTVIRYTATRIQEDRSMSTINEILDLDRERLLPARAAARFLGVSPTTLRKWSDEGLVRAVRTPSKGRRWRRGG